MTKYSIFNLLLISAIFFSLASCQKEILEVSKTYSNVDEELWVYFEQFEKEAANRGINVNLVASGITGSIEEINTDGVAGLCNDKLGQPNHVVIDINFWNRASKISKEMIIFHELGHCYLGRKHDDEKNSDGICLSIMRSGGGGCIDFYNNSNKKEYLDELYFY